MKALCLLLPILLCLVLIPLSCEAQFFTKTTNSIPRMGRRSEQMLPNLVKRVARTLRFVIDMVQEYDLDGNGELGPEELMEIPLIQSAVRNYMDVRDLRGQYMKYLQLRNRIGCKHGSAKNHGTLARYLNERSAFEEEGGETEPAAESGNSIDGRLVM